MTGGDLVNWGWQRDRLTDLERMLMLLDGKAIPDNRADVTRRLSDHIHENRHSTRYEDEMSVIKYRRELSISRSGDRSWSISERHYRETLSRGVAH
jgi:hypothetical protein